MVEHADLPVLDVADVNIVVNRYRYRFGVVQFTRVAARLRKQRERLERLVENADPPAALIDDDETTVGDAGVSLRDGTKAQPSLPRAIDQHGDDMLDLGTNAQLLYVRRTIDDKWQPPGD